MQIRHNSISIFILDVFYYYSNPCFSCSGYHQSEKTVFINYGTLHKNFKLPKLVFKQLMIQFTVLFSNTPQKGCIRLVYSITNYLLFLFY